ncbi:hypothetical protein P4S66_12720 [Pseudoalteromonas sp. B129b]
MRFLVLLGIFICFSSQAEEVCVDKLQLQAHMILQEFRAENSSEILHNINKIDLIKMFIEDLGGRGTQEQYERYDQFVELFISSIFMTIDFAKKNAVEIDLYENRVSSDVLDYISKNSRYFPKTLNSEDYILLRSEIYRIKSKP